MKKLLTIISLAIAAVLSIGCSGSENVAGPAANSSIVEEVSSSSSDTDTTVSYSSSVVTQPSSSSAVVPSSSSFVDTFDYTANNANFYTNCEASYGWWVNVGESGDLWGEISGHSYSDGNYDLKYGTWFTGTVFDGADTTAEKAYIRLHATSGKTVSMQCVAFMNRSVVESLKDEGYNFTVNDGVYYEQW